MNIFILNKTHSENVKMYVDSHIVKMPLEYAQMLCTVVNEKVGYQITPYKSTHINHPCTLWAGECKQNFLYLWNLMQYTDAERMFRFGKTEEHLSVRTLTDAGVYKFASLFRYSDLESELTEFPQCMPDYCKADTVDQAYRNYYLHEKQHIWKWTKRPMPDFIKQYLTEELVDI